MTRTQLANIILEEDYRTALRKIKHKCQAGELDLNERDQQAEAKKAVAELWEMDISHVYRAILWVRSTPNQVVFSSDIS